METLIKHYRAARARAKRLLYISRVRTRQLLNIEPVVPLDRRSVPLEQHGSAYCGWQLYARGLGPGSVILDFGLGEDITFSQSLIAKYGCTVHGFDPTPKAITYVRQLATPGFVLHEVGLAGSEREADFLLPYDTANVSGSLTSASHLGRESIKVRLVDLEGALRLAGAGRIDVLKMDIEGAEYEVLESAPFERLARDSKIASLCIEFHHRWDVFGPLATSQAVMRLQDLGFVCIWRSRTTNQEFTFLHRSAF